VAATRRRKFEDMDREVKEAGERDARERQELERAMYREMEATEREARVTERGGNVQKLFNQTHSTNKQA